MPNTPATAVALTLLASPALAWGPAGHRAVGRIAERHLSPETAREVAALLAPERLAYVTTWADEIRSDPAWAKGESWHWVTIPMGTTYADAKKNPAGDVVEALARFERVLADRSAPRIERHQALGGWHTSWAICTSPGVGGRVPADRRARLRAGRPAPVLEASTTGRRWSGGSPRGACGWRAS